MENRIAVVIPAYNEGSRLPAFLGELAAVLVGRARAPVELLISDDGSTPEHAEAYRAAAGKAAHVFQAAGGVHSVSVVRSERNQGKAAAIHSGWAAVSPEARWLAFLDADGAVGASEFVRLCAMLEEPADFDVLAASRIRMAGQHVHRHLFRHLRGRVFATMVDALLELGFYDTQCGLKFFRGELLRPALPLLRERGWLVDVELLARLKHAGARMREVPVDWEDKAGSKIAGALDPLKMLAGVLHLKRRLDQERRG